MISTASRDIVLEFEERPGPQNLDETDRGLRAYVAGLPPEKLALYNPNWTDQEVIDWDGNFRSDGELMLVCCEREVEVAEFRQVLEEWLEYRSR